MVIPFRGSGPPTSESAHLDTRAEEALPVHAGGASLLSGTALRRSRYHSSMVPPKRFTRHRSLSAARLSPAGRPLLLSFLVSLLLPADSWAQGTEGWNDPRALELVARARGVRQSAAVDPDLRSYQAIATGHVFFLVDRPSSGERTLVKADQLALEIYWRGPRDTRQRIIGMRDQKVLPTNIRYHLDHLTVVQDDFGDRIRLGDGDEVAAVVHPVAPGSQDTYDFRLADSLTISFAGSGGEVRVYEIQVRPRDSEMPGFVGSVFIDRTTAAIVRMTFTFTPASYVGRELDYIRISLDNSLWESKWWLPYRQELEIRRELPRLDFLVGSVIRGRFEIGDYEFNPDLADELFMGTRVTVVSEAQRESYPFTEPLIPEADARELAPTPTLEEIRAQALSLMKGHYMSGLSRLRLHLRSASDVFRWNRAEGATPASGFSFRPSNGLTLQAPHRLVFRSRRTDRHAHPDRGRGAAYHRHRTDLERAPRPGSVPRHLGGAQHPGRTHQRPRLDRSLVQLWRGSVPNFRTRRRSNAGGAPLGRQKEGVITSTQQTREGFDQCARVDEGDLMSVEAQTKVALPGNVNLAVAGRLGRFGPAGGGEATRDAVLVGALAWERAAPGTDGRVMARLDGGVAVER